MLSTVEWMIIDMRAHFTVIVCLVCSEPVIFENNDFHAYSCNSLAYAIHTSAHFFYLKL